MGTYLTYLFAPADSPHKIEKALASAADAIILDLEDGVAPADKEQARQNLLTFFKNPAPEHLKKKILVRCNQTGTADFPLDMEVIAQCQIHAVMLPKSESSADVSEVTKHLPNIEILPLLESARGLYNMPAIVQASSQIRRVAFGSVDYALDLGVDWTAEGIERNYAMGHIVVLSRALNLAPPIGAVFPSLDQEEAFFLDTQRNQQTGFFGRMIIHPRQIDTVLQVYQPAPEQREWYQRVVTAYEAEGGLGSIQLDGQLIDLPVYKRAKRALEGE